MIKKCKTCSKVVYFILLFPFSSLLSGEAYMRLSRLEEAGHWYRESLRVKPDHIPAHLTYGKLLSIIVCSLTDTHSYRM